MTVPLVPWFEECALRSTRTKMTDPEITIEMVREPNLENVPIIVNEVDGVYYERDGPGRFYRCSDSVFVFAGSYSKEQAVRMWEDGQLPETYIYRRKLSEIDSLVRADFANSSDPPSPFRKIEQDGNRRIDSRQNKS